MGRTPRSWTGDEDALLGTASDASIGERIGRRREVVTRRRRTLGVPTYDGPFRRKHERTIGGDLRPYGFTVNPEIYAKIRGLPRGKANAVRVAIDRFWESLARLEPIERRSFPGRTINLPIVLDLKAVDRLDELARRHEWLANRSVVLCYALWRIK